MIKLWKLYNKVNTGYGTYGSCVVAADTEDEARMIHPDDWHKDWGGKEISYGSWCDSDKVVVEYLGYTDREVPSGTVIIASFHAG